jgi:PKHD-type hydroxylase
MDIGPQELAFRKLSLVVQLSNPSDYSGGDLQIRSGHGEATVSKTQGTVIVFPSYLLHQVTPVTGGLRESLVLWSGGNSYK